VIAALCQSDWLASGGSPGPAGMHHCICRKKQDMSKALTRWSPLHELQEFQNRILSAFVPDHSKRENGQESITMAEWMPLVDISEDDHGYLITLELPEVKKEDVKVTLENSTLTITGERKFEKEQTGKRYHRVERSYGSFARSFAMPDNGDATKVSAEFKDGLLKVRVAKSEAARPKQIEVKVD
jgi:HSP20 family protein